MTQVTLLLDQNVADFYQKVALQADFPLEKVLSDALYKLAGELSLEAIRNKEGINYIY